MSRSHKLSVPRVPMASLFYMCDVGLQRSDAHLPCVTERDCLWPRFLRNCVCAHLASCRPETSKPIMCWPEGPSAGGKHEF